MSLQPVWHVNPETATDPNVAGPDLGVHWPPRFGAQVTPLPTIASPWQGARTDAMAGHEEIDEGNRIPRVDADFLLASVIQILQSTITVPPRNLTGQLVETPYWSDAQIGSEDNERWLKVYEAIEAYGSSNPDLRDALSDLSEVTVEAQEEGYPAPSREALDNADRILRRMYRISPQRFEVYPIPKGAVAIDAAYCPGSSLVVLCASDGNASCLVNVNGKVRKASYSDADLLPDEFVRKALQELAYRRNLTK